MKIILNNKEFKFKDLEIKNNTIYIRSKFNFSPLINHYKIEYDQFIDLFSSSLENYVDIEPDIIRDGKINEKIDEYYNFIKITTNPMVKKNMAIKIGNIITSNFDCFPNSKVDELINNYKPTSQDDYYVFLKMMLRLESITFLFKDEFYYDQEFFTLKDFILDYYD